MMKGQFSLGGLQNIDNQNKIRPLELRRPSINSIGSDDDNNQSAKG